MIGLDTTVLVAFEVQEVPAHRRVRERVLRICEEKSENFVLCPQVLYEFLHVVTDRMSRLSGLSAGAAG